ncbi:uncharacterized protein [Procambarus clarkii]|uniref:uncharacterized protein isoform X2 n=1 Tax=Procambarus clarkii TaxID=6728 RepID=UPI003742F3D6
MESDDQEYVDSASGVMVSNLPLLFSRGSPSSLHEMSVAELEEFVPFVVRCSLGEERPVPWAQLPRPTWWPKKLPFRMPTTNNTNSTRSALVGLVERCYTFHGCQYLLQFCASLVTQMPASGYRFNDNRDGTTSMYHGTTGKLLVTFRNENRDYDKYSHGRSRDTTKKLLLSPSPHTGERKGSGGGTTAMFQPPATDIYLCDKCESEFYSLREVQTHEKQCRGDMPSSPVAPSPELDLVDDEPEPAGQVPFLAYFNLQPAKHTGVEPYMSPRKRSSSSPPRKIPGPMYPRYDSIAISSPLGRFLFSHSKFRNKYQPSQHNVMRYERHLHATPNTDFNLSRDRCNSRWIVVWRDRKEEQPWVHLYCFTSGQRRDRRITINSGLNWRSRRLLRLCRPLKIEMKRLQKRMVDRIMRLGGPTAPCIDLTDECQVDNMWAFDRYPALADNSMLLNSRPAPWSSRETQFCTNEDPFSPKASSSSGTLAGTIQWLDGLPEMSDNVSVPGGSGILNSGGLLSSILTSNRTAQLGISELNSNKAIQQGSLKFIPLPLGSQHLLTNQQHAFQSAFIQKSQIGQFGSKNQLGQMTSYSVDGTSLSLKMNASSTADISLIPLKTSVKHDRSNRQLNSDILKPLSRKKYAFCDSRSNVQQINASEQSNNDSRISVTGHQQEQNRHLTHMQSESMPKGSQSIYSQIVPRMSERDSSAVSLNNTSITLSSISHPTTNSSIEIIDLSSDDDDVVRARGQSEADNAPQQLDGLACYPHTGAKVPDSSDYSLPKNGSSHWSSEQKSHCGAGHVGDLATNGQPPNVPPSLATSPVPHVLFLPNDTVPPPATQGPEMKGNSRKRKSKEPPCGGGKMIILDISNKGVISSEGNIAEESRPSKEFLLSKEDNQVTVIPEEVVPVTPEELNNAHLTPLTEATLLKVSDQSGALERRKYSHATNKSFIVDEDISFKSPFRVDEDISFRVPTVNLRESEHNTEGVTPLKVTETQNKHLPTVGTQVGGIISTIVNTVNKGVEFFKSWVGTDASQDVRHNCMSSLTSNRLHSEMLGIGKPLKDKNGAEQTEKISSFQYTSYKIRKSEIVQLFKDECRELKCKGLGELRHLDVQETRLTRRSLEKFLPSKARRKNSDGLNYRRNTAAKSESGNTSAVGATDHFNSRTRTQSEIIGTRNSRPSRPSVMPEDYISCTDENGNSASYLTLDGKSVDSSSNCGVAQRGSFGLYSENSKEYRESIITENMFHGKGPLDVNNEKQLTDNYSNKEIRCTVHSEPVIKDSVLLSSENSVAARGIFDVTNTERKRFSVSTRELVNLTSDEWKEMQHRGFHPVTNIKPGLLNVGHLKKQFPRLEGSAACLNTVLESSEIDEQIKNLKKNSVKMVRELKSLAQDECKEIIRMGFNPSQFVISEIKRKELRQTHCGIKSPVGDNVDVSPTFVTDAKSGFMGETAEESGALQARIPTPEEPQENRYSNKLESILVSDSGTSKSIVLDCTQVAGSTVQPQAPNPKKKRSIFKSLCRELNNLGKDEYKELRGTGFHPSDYLGSEDVKYLNASSDEDDVPLYHSKGQSINGHRTGEIKSSDVRRKKEKLSIKMNRELSGLLSDECKELRVGRHLLKSVSQLRRASHVGNIRTQSGDGSYRTTRSALPTPSINFPSVLLKSGMTNSPTKTRMRCQVRNTRSQTNVVSNLEVFTPRSSHRQILLAERAMCVLNFNLPVIN